MQKDPIEKLWLKKTNVDLSNILPRQITKEMVRITISESHESSPCPEWIPIGVWKLSGQIGVDIIYDMVKLNLLLNRKDRDLPRDFNHSWLFLIPKEADGTDSEGRKIYKASATPVPDQSQLPTLTTD